MSRTKLLLFTLLPLLLLVLVAEVVCTTLPYARQTSRLYRVGYVGCYFRPTSDGLIELCEANPDPRYRVRFPAQKPAGRCRVAFLGASSVRLFPTDTEQWPARVARLVPNVESLNLGVPGSTSAAVAMRGEAALAYDVDVVVVYEGHNDLAQGVFFEGRDKTLHASLRFVRLQFLLHRSALYRTLLHFYAPLPRQGAVDVRDPRQVERTSPIYSDAEKQALVSTLAANYRRLIGKASPKPVIVAVPISSPAAAPLGTLVPADPGEVDALRQQLELAQEKLTAGDDAGALAALEAAMTAFPTSARAWWLRSQALARLHRGDDAAEAFAKARELDALPLRATPGMEAAIRAVPASATVDLPTALRGPDGLLPASYFIDNLHFSAEGHEQVARAVAPAVARACEAAGR